MRLQLSKRIRTGSYYLSADKGNCVVVTEKQQYHDKALSLLNDKSTYAVLNSDPTSKTQRKLNKRYVDDVI